MYVAGQERNKMSTQSLSPLENNPYKLYGIKLLIYSDQVPLYEKKSEI